MRVGLLHASAGSGHQKIAEAIREGLMAEGISSKEIFLEDTLHFTPSWFKKAYTGLYYYSVKHTPRLWGATYEFFDLPWFYQKVARYARRWVNGAVGQRLITEMVKDPPEAIVVTHFMPAEILSCLKQEGALPSFLVTVITDFLPHAFWVNPGTDHYWVMSREGEQDLKKRGVSREKITAGGIPISLRFRPEGKKRERRREEGLHEDRFTILLTSGSFGLGPAEAILDSLREFSDKIQVIVVCGHNESLTGHLKARRDPFPTLIHGFVPHMDALMEASDLLIAKPGGATTSESLAKGLPMVVLEAIPGQEFRNAQVLKEKSAAFFLGKPSDIRVVLKGILDYPEVLEEKRRTIRDLAKPDAARELARFILKAL